MATPHEGRIGEQHEAYRKGLVLGLTMAEIAILIIFVLLLLLVFNQVQRATLVRQLGGRDPLSLVKRADAFDTIAGAMGGVPDDTSADFVRLVRVVAQTLRRPQPGAALSEAKIQLANIKRARNEIERIASAATSGGADSLARKVEQQSYVNANQEGQIAQLRAKLDSVGGRGGELPSCWAEQGGRIDFVYDVILASNGLRVREYEYGQRQRERMLITTWVPDPNEVLSEDLFLERTRPWYDYSEQHDCRFFVVVYDDTAPFEKPLYKSLLKTVERHFYKRLDDGHHPF